MFGKAASEVSNPANAGASAGADEPHSGDLEQYLRDLTTSLDADARRGRVPYGAPPPVLEHRLNGGANPRIARYYADILVRQELPSDAQILDMGCGYGRIALELATRLTSTQNYVGLDPHPDAVDWAAGNITPLHPNFTFAQVDISSKVYNAAGELDGANYRFPFEDSSLDLVFMISVMTHIDIDTVTTYVREAARTLKPTGRLVATFFLLDDEVDQFLDSGRATFTLRWPHGPSRVENPKNPELAIGHPRDLVLRILTESGFTEPTIAEGTWSGRSGPSPMNFQDLVIAPRSAAAASAAVDVSEIAYEAEGSADAPDDDSFQTAAARLATIGIPHRDAAAELLTWANPVILNVLWWQDRGLTLAVDHGDRIEPFVFTFPCCRALGFDSHSPVPLESAGDGSDSPVSELTFTPVSPHDLLDLLVDAGGAATRQAILDCALEVAEYGVSVRDALQRGERLVLIAPGSPPRPAPIALHS